jgi:hypothetical protein
MKQSKESPAKKKKIHPWRWPTPMSSPNPKDKIPLIARMGLRI